MEQESEKDPVHRSRKKRFIPLNHTQRHSTLTGIAKDHLASWRSYLHTCGKEEGEKKSISYGSVSGTRFFFHLTCLFLGNSWSYFFSFRFFACLFVCLYRTYACLFCLFVCDFVFFHAF